MNTKILVSLFGAVATVTSVLSAPAQAFAPTANPLPSDLLSYFTQEFVQKERQAVNNPYAYALDPSSLVFANGANAVELYFVNEGAGMIGSLFTKINGGAEQTVIQEISSTQSIISESDGKLTLGQGWNLGQQAAGTALEFLLAPWQGSDRRYGANAAANADGLQHMVAYQYLDWVIIGFEDLYGELGATGGNNQNSDRDFNDVVFAIRGVAGRPVTPPTDVPEPAGTVALFGLGAFGLLARRRRSNSIG